MLKIRTGSYSWFPLTLAPAIIRLKCGNEIKTFVFYPRENKKYFVVMPFGSNNAPAFYTTIMKILHDNWVILLNSTKDIVPSDMSITKIFYDSKIIVDDILIYSNHIPTLFHHFSWFAEDFTKYRLSFKLLKFDFFLPRIEYVGHDLTADGNCLPQSKFEFIKQWPLPPHSVSLLSFITLCSFYNDYTCLVASDSWRFRKLQDKYDHCTSSSSIW